MAHDRKYIIIPSEGASQMEANLQLKKDGNWHTQISQNRGLILNTIH